MKPATRTMIQRCHQLRNWTLKRGRDVTTIENRKNNVAVLTALEC
uniref:Uncharacterized protein n=1 Tax=Anguilla anguilla TaxID=7936 RepID=A0A0E9XTH2_ANGAN